LLLNYFTVGTNFKLEWAARVFLVCDNKTLDEFTFTPTVKQLQI